MSSARSSDCLVGCELSHDRIRFAVLTAANGEAPSRARAAVTGAIEGTAAIEPGSSAEHDPALKSRGSRAERPSDGSNERTPSQTGTIAEPGVRAGRGAVSTGRRLRCGEIVIPKIDEYAPVGLPPASELAGALKATLSRLGVSGARAATTAVAIDGSRMVLRYFVGSDDEVRSGLQQGVERSMQYVQLGVGDRVVGEYVHRRHDGRQHGLLGVAAAATIDPLTQLLEQAALRAVVIEPALVAVARLALVSGVLNSQEALLVLVGVDGMDLGVMSSGHLLFSRRPPPPRATENPPRIDLPRELQKMARHFVRAFDASNAVRQVLLCGSEDAVQPYLAVLADSEEFQAHWLRIDNAVFTALGMDSGDPADEGGSPEHTVALGAAASLIQRGSDGLPADRPVVGPNLTSEPEIKRKPPLETLIRAALIPTLVALGLWGAAAFVQGRLERTVARLRIEADHPSLAETRHRELQMELTQAEQRTARLGKLVQAFQDRNWRGLVEMVRVCVPDQLWLTRVQRKSDELLTIDGAAYDESLIYQFREDLEGAPLFASATIVTTTSSRHDNTIVVEFTVECMIGSGSANLRAG